MTPSPQHQHEKFCPPIISLAIAGVLFWSAGWLVDHGGLYAGEWATPLAIVVFVIGARKVVRAGQDQSILWAYAKKRRRFLAAAEHQGKARLGGAGDALGSKEFSE